MPLGAVLAAIISGFAGTVRADYLRPLPVKPEQPPCILLEGEHEDKPGSGKQKNLEICYGELVEHNVARAFVHGKTLVLRKAGHTHSSATLRYKLPDDVKPGDYSIWTCFTLGGVATQLFVVRAGADPEKLEERVRFRQSNGQSWKFAWRRASAGIVLKPEDRWVEITVTGLASQQKQIDAFLLVSPTESVRLREAVSAFRGGNDLLTRFTVLERAEPAEANVFLRHFVERADELKNKVSVRVLDGAEADAVAKRLAITTRPAVVVADRVLAAPATAVEVAAFVQALEQTPRVLLECEAKPSGAPESAAVYGELVAHTADRLVPSRNDLILRKNGHVWHTATVRWTLPQSVRPGQYDVWTLFTLGGVAGQTFIVRLGPDADHLKQRIAFAQSNVVSWRKEWRKGSIPLKVYPGDGAIEIEVRGLASQQKQLDALELVLTEPLPANLTVETGQWRAATDSFASSDPDYRIYILESKDGRDADPLFRHFAEGRAPRDKLAITTFIGASATDLARRLRLARLPAMLVMDARYALRGVLSGSRVEDRKVADFLASAMKPGRAPGPFLERAPCRAEDPAPLQNGSPRAWLVVGQWGGPAGFSLLGIDAEPRLRPNPGTSVTAMVFDSRRPTGWTAQNTTERGTAVIDPNTGDYVWARGAGYAHVYLLAENDTNCLLQVAQTGIRSAAWLDGEALAFEKDPDPPSAFRGTQQTPRSVVESKDDQGTSLRVTLGKREPPVRAKLKLSKGWHRLLLKLVMRHGAGEAFAFAARLADADGSILTGVKTQLSDPQAAHELRGEVLRLAPALYAEAPANLVHPGQPLKLRFDLRWQRSRQDEKIIRPVNPLDAELVLEMTDYDGKEVRRRELQEQFPNVVTVDFGEAPQPGYYAVQATLYDKDDRTILVCPPDGFSVIRGTAAQYERRQKKKMAVTYYFMGSGERATYHTAFPWMTRMGIYRNIGSSPSFPLDMAEAAWKAGITLTMDFWDIHNAYTQRTRNELAEKAAAYTEWYKSFNEVDIHHKVRGTPQHWVSRTKGEYEAVKAACLDGFFVGGSLVRPGSDDWFTNCLKLGLDKYVDGWDVHAYPQRPPNLEGTLSNSPNETELGVINCYKRLGRTNTKPFWIGETGARACHGFDARRWQADTIAKMVACVCSREDFHYVGFLWPWTYGLRNDIVTAHLPGEAAYYTASALIDGFPYSRLDLGDKQVQAALFGDARMLWTTGPPKQISLPLPDAGPWLVVDVVGRARTLVVGRARTLVVGARGAAQIGLTGSPVYILSKAGYERLTAFR